MLRLLLFFIPLCVLATPKGEKIVHGSLDIEREGASVKASQYSDHAIIDWEEFSIGSNEEVHFLQPSAESAVLNRVKGPFPSEIYGLLKGDGQIFLINPQGVIIGSSGRVDAASFVASALDLENASFLKGEDLVFKGPSEAIVSNEGRIVARQGHALLIGPSVSNQGTLFAPKGEALLIEAEGVWIKTLAEEKVMASFIEDSSQRDSSHARLLSEEPFYAYAINQTDKEKAVAFKKVGGRTFLIGEEIFIAEKGEGENFLPDASNFSDKSEAKREKSRFLTSVPFEKVSQDRYAAENSMSSVLDPGFTAPYANYQEDSLVSMQQMRSLIPERLWYQEFSLLFNQKAFQTALSKWTTSLYAFKEDLPQIQIGVTECYFLRDTLSGEAIRILDSYEEFLNSPYWKNPPRLAQFKEKEKKLMRRRR